MSKKIVYLIFTVTFAISFGMHYTHLRKDLVSVHVWRQTQTQSTINSFYEEDMNILNPRRNDRGNTNGIFRMEFPLMQWLIAFLYKLFGKKIIITRLFMLFTGFCTVLGMYHFLKELFKNTQPAILGAVLFNFSPCFYYYTINPLPDVFALCLGVWGLALFFKWYNSKKDIYLVCSGFALGVAALSKLPFVLYFVLPATYFCYQFFYKKEKTNILKQGFYVFIFSLMLIAWYVSVIPDWGGNMIVKGMMNNKESFAFITEAIWHNLISTFPELLINYSCVLFFIVGAFLFFNEKKFLEQKGVIMLSLLFAVLAYFLFEINAIEKVHDYYLFPFYPLLFAVIAAGALHLYNSKVPTYRVAAIFLLLLTPITCYLRMRDRWDEKKPGFNADLLLYKTELQNAVPKNDLVIAGNDISHFIFMYYIDKKGWTFHNNELDISLMDKYIEEGAKYLYTDSDTIANKLQLNHNLQKLLIQKGSIKVYKLKRSTY